MCDASCIASVILLLGGGGGRTIVFTQTFDTLLFFFLVTTSLVLVSSFNETRNRKVGEWSVKKGCVGLKASENGERERKKETKTAAEGGDG